MRKLFARGFFKQVVDVAVFSDDKNFLGNEGVEFHLLLGLSYFELGSKQGTHEVTRLEELNASPAELALIRGAESVMNKNYKRALILLDTPGIVQSFDYYINYKKGQCYPENIGKAEVLFVKAVKAKPSFSEPYLRVGLLLRNTNLKIKYLEHYTSLKPNSFDAYTALGKAYMKAKSLKKSIEAYNKASKLRPQDAKAFVSYLEALLFAKRFKDLVNVVNKNLNGLRYDADVLYLLAEAYLGLDRADSTILVLKALSDKKSGELTAPLLALAYLSKKDIASADKLLSANTTQSSLFSRLLRAAVMLYNAEPDRGVALLKNDSRHVHYFTALLRGASGKFAEAAIEIKKDQKLINVDNLPMEGYFRSLKKSDYYSLYMGALCLKRAYYKTAYRLLGDAGSFETNFLIQTLLGKSALLMENLELAYKHSKKSFSIESRFKGNLEQLADINHRRKRYSEAIDYYQKLLKLDEKNTSYLFMIALACDQSKAYEEAVVYYQKLIKLNPKSYVGLNQIAWDLGVNLNRPQEALKYAMDALKISRDNGAVLDTVGWLHFLLGNYEKAEKFLVMAQKRFSSDSNLFHIAMTKSKLGRFDEARAILKKILERDFPEKEEAYSLLDTLGRGEKRTGSLSVYRGFYYPKTLETQQTVKHGVFYTRTA